MVNFPSHSMLDKLSLLWIVMLYNVISNGEKELKASLLEICFLKSRLLDVFSVLTTIKFSIPAGLFETQLPAS